jgi:CCR4-NOT transcription complex subunit 2
VDVVAGAPRGVNATQGSGSDQYSLLGLLNVIRMTDQDMNTLALGIDLTTLGLSLNAPEYVKCSLSSKAVCLSLIIIGKACFSASNRLVCR